MRILCKIEENLCELELKFDLTKFEKNAKDAGSFGPPYLYENTIN